MFRELRASLSLFIILALITGFAYPMLVMGVGQKLFPSQANGSLIRNDQGKIIGSALIGQSFSNAIYFHPRPSVAGNGYDATQSSGSNLAPTSPDLINAVRDRSSVLKKNDSLVAIPVDLVTASGSGLDPDISPAAAKLEAAQVAEARHMDLVRVQDLITQHTTARTWGFLGDNRVNVLELNRALDQITPPTAPSH